MVLSRPVLQCGPNRPNLEAEEWKSSGYVRVGPKHGKMVQEVSVLIALRGGVCFISSIMQMQCMHARCKSYQIYIRAARSIKDMLTYMGIYTLYMVNLLERLWSGHPI